MSTGSKKNKERTLTHRLPIPRKIPGHGLSPLVGDPDQQARILSTDLGDLAEQVSEVVLPRPGEVDHESTRGRQLEP